MTDLCWYGWGDAAKTYPLDRRPGAWTFLRAVLDLSGDEHFPVCDFESINLRRPRVSEAVVQESFGCGLGAGTEEQVLIRTDKRARITHAFGKSYRDLVRLRRGEVLNPLDAVVYPSTEDQVAQRIQFCAAKKIALIPFGGGSSVVGGVEPSGDRVTLTLDLSRMNQLLELDALSQVAVFWAGILRPDLNVL